MQITKKYFPEIIPDNELEYLSLLEGVISSVDEFASIQVSRLTECYHFRLSPSSYKYTNLLIKEITKLHTLLHIRIDMSKSIKTTGNIVFKINT